MEIRESTPADRAKIANIHTMAFGEKEGPEIAELVTGLFDDPSARPRLSLVAHKNGNLIGHILFTKAVLAGTDKQQVSAQLLAPLAVLPDDQAKGVGGQLIEAGLSQLKDAGVDLVFVLGHPGYYPRCGFTTAGILGFEAPYPIPEKNADAWMVHALHEGLIGRIQGQVRCADVLDQPQHWRE